LKGLTFSRATLGSDLSAGVTVALVSIAEGMAYALVAGVPPIYGLYAGMVTVVIGSLTSSTHLLVITLTNALALVTSDRLDALGSDVDPIQAMFTLTLLVGVFMTLLGVLNLGSVIRFVSKEVLSGFVFATALLIVLGQYKDLVGYASALDTNKLFKAIDITLHFADWQLSAAVVGFGLILLLFIVKRTPLRNWADILAILVGTLVALIPQLGGIERIGDIASVPSGLAALPLPVLPDFGLIPLVLAGALAATVVGLAESSGVGAAYPNPDGTRSSMSRDFLAQGLANLGGSLFRALPAGGSLSRTGVNASAGAKSRWAGVYGGLLLAAILVLFGGLAELIPMTSLAAVLIVIGIETMRKEGEELSEAWKVSRINTATAIVTIVIGIFFDLTNAIFGGVILSLLLFAVTAASRFEALEMVRNDDGSWREQPLPKQLPSNQVTVISVDGNVYFASIYTLEDLLPESAHTTNAVVVLHFRNRIITSLTEVDWLEQYARKLQAGGNRLMLSGVDDQQMAIFERSEVMDLLGPDAIFRRDPTIGASTAVAAEAGTRWIAAQPAKRAQDPKTAA
jgi:SulP family sulfate permease